MKDMQQRKTCRKFYKELRDNMSQEVVCEKSDAICENILNSEHYKQAEMILGYYPLGNEVDCLPVLKRALSDGKQIALPRTAKDCQMDFYEIHSLEDVKEGNFHVMEPKTTCARIEPDFNNVGEQDKVSSARSMITLVPGVVFDQNGNRYGYGKGFYDRYFSRFPELTRIALAYTEQLAEEPLACLDTDVKMHFIVTEYGIMAVE